MRHDRARIMFVIVQPLAEPGPVALLGPPGLEGAHKRQSQANAHEKGHANAGDSDLGLPCLEGTLV